MKIMRRAAIAAVTGLALARGVEARAQSSSLYGSPERRRALTLADSSWFYIKPDEPPEIQLNDVITVIVDQKSQYINQAQLRRQQGRLDCRGVDAEPRAVLGASVGYPRSRSVCTNGRRRRGNRHCRANVSSVEACQSQTCLGQKWRRQRAAGSGFPASGTSDRAKSPIQ